ncbi:MAG: glycosyltransferase family 39 protein [Patescibacteria group bacterium]
MNVFNQSFWLDEAISVKAAILPLKDLLFVFSPGDFHPPLYYLVLKLWISIFGTSETAVRSLSLVFALLSVLLLFFIAKKLFNKFVAISSASLLATAPLLFYYSQEARMYAMSVFASLLVVWCFINIVYNKNSRMLNWVSFIISSSLLIYTDYLPGLVLLFCAAFLIFQKKSLGVHRFAWITSFITILILFIPWLAIFKKQLEVGVQVKQNAPIWWETLGKTNLKQITLVPVKFLIGRISFYNKFVYAAFVGLFAFEFGISLWNSLKKYKESHLVWLWFLIPLSGALIFGLIMSGFSYFRLLFLLPPFYLLVAHGIFLVNKKTGKLYFRVGLNLLAISIFAFTPRFWREDWRSAVLWLESDAKGQSAISIFVTKSQQDPYMYYAKNVPSYGPDGLEGVYFEKIYLFRYVQPIFDPTDQVRKSVEGMGFTKVEERDFNGVTVWKYQNASKNLAAPEP